MESLQIRPSEARNIVLRAMKGSRPIFIWGPPGIGKSEIVDSITHNDLPGNNLMIDMRLALMEPNDLRGYPFRNPDTNTMDWAPPADLPSEEVAALYDHIVLFLDELNSAPPSVQAAAYQLVLNGKIGQYVLPKNVRIVAAGNRDTDRGVTYRMPAPLANRFNHINLSVNFDDWKEWAFQNDVHADVLGYLSYAKQDLFDFDPKTSSQAFATPRSWVNGVSSVLKTEGFNQASDHEQKAEIAASIGEGMAIKFCEHRKYSSRLPNPEDVLTGKVKKLDIKEKSAQYSFAVGLCYELAVISKGDEGVFDKGVDYFFDFIMNNFEPELVIYSAKTVLSDHNIDIKPRKLQGKKEFKDRYWKYLFPSN